MAKKKKSGNNHNSGNALNKYSESVERTAANVIENDDHIEKLISPASPVAQLCDEQLKLFCKGGRANLKAKKALRKLADTYPNSPLPQRYLARVLYHEASMLEPAERSSAETSKRLDLILEALAAASTASELCPRSLSCAVLRATLVVNVLLEKSQSIAGNLAPGQQGLATSQQCEEMRLQFKEASECCEKVLKQTNPILEEPVIYISAGAQKTPDPCCLRIQDRVQSLVATKSWSELVAQKRYVLNYMHDVLNSCYQLLNTTQAPQAAVSAAFQNLLREGLDPCSPARDSSATLAELMKQVKSRPYSDMGPPPTLPRPPIVDHPPASLSIDLDAWDQGRDMLGARRKQRGRVVERRGGGEPLNADVKDYWSRMSEQERQKLFIVPARDVLALAQQEKSSRAVEDLELGLELLWHSDNTRAAYWTCPHCIADPPEKRLLFFSRKEFCGHVREDHEEVVTLPDSGGVLPCNKCGKEIVGVHYVSPDDPPESLCLHCYEDAASSDAYEDYQRENRVPRDPHAPWDEDSDWSSPKDSIDDSEEDSDEDMFRADPYPSGPGPEAASNIWGGSMPSTASAPLQDPGSTASFAARGAADGYTYPPLLGGSHLAQPSYGLPSPMPVGISGPIGLQQMLHMHKSRGGLHSGRRPRRRLVPVRRSPTEQAVREAADASDRGSESATDEEDDGLEDCNGDSDAHELSDPWTTHLEFTGNGEVGATAARPHDTGQGLMPNGRAGPGPPRFDGSSTSPIWPPPAMSMGHIPGIGTPAETVSPQGGASALWANASGAPDILASGAVLATSPLQVGQIEEPPDEEMIDDVMEMVKFLWTTDPENFAQRFTDIASKMSAMLEARASTKAVAAAALLRTSAKEVDTKEQMEAALKELSAGDVHQLLVYVGCISDTMLNDRAGTDSESDVDDDERYCQPLFQIKTQQRTHGSPQAPLGEFLLGQMVGERLESALDDIRVAMQSKNSEPVLCVQEWWLNHLLLKSKEESDNDVPGGHVLRWIYGAVLLRAAHNFAERQRELKGNRRVDEAMLDLYGDLAVTWRHLHQVLEQRNHVKTMRRTVETRLREVQDLEDQPSQRRLRASAADVAHAMKGYVTAFPPDSRPPEEWRGDEQPVGVDPHALHPEQKEYHEPLAARYALALLEMDLAVLDMAMAMLEQDIADYQGQGASVAERLAQARNNTFELEAQLQRLESEGPASHRKRDPLDKVTKEVEHRTKCDDIKNTIILAKAKIAGAEEIREGLRDTELVTKEALGNAGLLAQVLRDHLQALKAVCQACKDCDGDGRSLSAVYCAYYVAEAIHRHGAREFTVAGTPAAAQHAHSESRARKLLIRLHGEISRYRKDLECTRSKLQELACVDLSVDVAEAVLEVIRRRLETAAKRAKEEATTRLLLELEEEEHAKKAAQKEAQEKQRAKKSKGKKKGAQQDVNKNKPGVSTAAAAGGSEALAGTAAVHLSPEELKKAQDAEYEAALTERAAALAAREAELIQEQIDRMEQMQLHQDEESVRESMRGDPDEDEGLSDDEGVSGPGSSAAVTAPSVNSGPVIEDEFEAETRAAIQISLQSYEQEQAAAARKGAHANGDWQEVGNEGPPDPEKKKKKNRKQRYKENLEKEKEAVPQYQMKIVSHVGDWMCECGQTNRLWDACACSKAGPCRDWVRGRCKYKTTCRFPHPPFCLPNGPAPPLPIARPPQDEAQPSSRPKAVPATRLAESLTPGPTDFSGDDDTPTVPLPYPLSTVATATAAASMAPPPLIHPTPPPPKPNAWAVRPTMQGIAGAGAGAPSVALGAPATSYAPSTSAQPEAAPPAPPNTRPWGETVPGNAWAKPASSTESTLSRQASAGAPGVPLGDRGAYSMPGGWSRAPGGAAETRPMQDQVVAPPPIKRTVSPAALHPSVSDGVMADTHSWQNFNPLTSSWGTSNAQPYDPFRPSPLGPSLTDHFRLAKVAAEPIRTDSLASSRFSLPASLDMDERMDPNVEEMVNQIIEVPTTGQSDPVVPPPPAPLRRPPQRLVERVGEPKSWPPIPPNASSYGINPKATPFTPTSNLQAAEAQRSSAISGLEGKQSMASQGWGFLTGQVAVTQQQAAAQELPSQSLQTLMPSNSGAAGWAGLTSQWGSFRHEAPATNPPGSSLFGRGLTAQQQTSTAPPVPLTAFEQLWKVDTSLGDRREGPEHRALAKEGHRGTLLHVDSSELLGLLYSLAHALWSISCFRDTLRHMQASSLPDSGPARVFKALQAIFIEMSNNSAKSAMRPSFGMLGGLTHHSSGTSFSSLGSGDTASSMLGAFGNVQNAQVANPCAVPDALLVDLWEQLSAAGLFAADGMLDGSEALDTLLWCLDVAERTASLHDAPSHTQSIFGLAVSETVDCQNCVRSECMQYVKYTQLVRTHSLQEEYKREKLRLQGLLLRMAAAERLPCRIDQGGGCGYPTSRAVRMERAPVVFAMVLVWDSPPYHVESNRMVCGLLPEQIDVGQIYNGLERGVWRAKTVICVDSSMQYKIFVSQDNHWCLYDARSMTSIGAWEALRATWSRTGMQPQTLLYEKVQ